MQLPQGFSIRRAERRDVPLVLSFIRKIAAYEKMSGEVQATCGRLEDSIFEREAAWVFLGEMQGEPVGFALFYESFSTFTGRTGLHLEDLYVDEAFRGRGFGKALFQAVAEEAVRRECPRMEWTCLNWNTPSIRFYQSMGACALHEWTSYRLAGEGICRAVEK